MAEHREMRLAAEKRLRALEMDVDKKKEKEQNEMLGELKSAIKEEFGTLKSQVCENRRPVSSVIERRTSV